MSNTHLPPQWDKRLLAMIGSHGWDTGNFAHEAMRLLAGWCRAEGGSAEWDPLNSTSHIVEDGIPWQGWDYNTVGVSNYTKQTYGVMATVATLLNGKYPGILGYLQSPQITAEEAVAKYKPQFQTWGTDTALLLEVLKEIP